MHNREIAYALLRVTFGVMLLFYGIGKFLRGTDGFVEGMLKRFEESPLPAALVEPFAHVLPYLEVVLGTLVLLGLFSAIALLLAGLLMLALVFGTVMEPSPPTVANNVLYVLVVFILLWTLEHNRYSADCMLDRKA